MRNVRMSAVALLLLSVVVWPGYGQQPSSPANRHSPAVNANSNSGGVPSRSEAGQRNENSRASPSTNAQETEREPGGSAADAEHPAMPTNSLKISSEGLELVNFPTWLILIVIVIAALLFGFWYFMKKRGMRGLLPKTVAVLTALMAANILLLVGIWWGWRGGVRGDLAERLRTAKPEAETQTQNPVSSAPPDAPTGLMANALSDSEVRLSWAAKRDNSLGVKLERKADRSGTYQQIAILGPEVSSYSDAGLSPETTAYYRLRAYNTNEDSVYSKEVSATTRRTATPVSSDASGSRGLFDWFLYLILPTFVLLTGGEIITYLLLVRRERRGTHYREEGWLILEERIRALAAEVSYLAPSGSMTERIANRIRAELREFRYLPSRSIRQLSNELLEALDEDSERMSTEVRERLRSSILVLRDLVTFA